jgi:NADP-dependent 3-hydroxy acid dehydrogenase YdfG
MISLTFASMGDAQQLAGETALITGASSGIGRATADALAARGANIALAARRQDRLAEIGDEIEAEYDVETLAVGTNVRDESAVTELVERTVERFGQLDVVVNNAGIIADMMSSLEDMTTDSYRATMETNVDGVFFTTQAALSHLRETEGTIVFVGSFTGKYPTPYTPVYAASKAWVRMFAQSVDAMVGDDGVAVTVVNPAETRTELGGDDTGTTQEERYDPGDASEPEELAEAIAFAASLDVSTVSELDLFRPGRMSDTFK